MGRGMAILELPLENQQKASTWVRGMRDETTPVPIL